MSNYVNLNSTRHLNQDGTAPPLTDLTYYTTTQPMMTTPNMLPEMQSRAQRPAYKTTLAFKLAVAQIINGVSAVCCGMVILILRTYLYFTGIGIGSGAVFISAGVLGILSARNRATWSIVSCLVLSIVAAVASGVTVIASSEGIYLNHIGHPFYEINNEKVLRTGIAMDTILIVNALTEIVAAIFQATLCCRVTCCMTPNQPEIMVVYVPQQMTPAVGASPGDMTTVPVPAPVVLYPTNQQPAFNIPPPGETNA